MCLNKGNINYFHSHFAVVLDDSSGTRNEAAHLFKIPQSLSGNCSVPEEEHGYCSVKNVYAFLSCDTFKFSHSEIETDNRMWPAEWTEIKRWKNT